jgi:hypothetical protein
VTRAAQCNSEYRLRWRKKTARHALYQAQGGGAAPLIPWPVGMDARRTRCLSLAAIIQHTIARSHSLAIRLSWTVIEWPTGST